MAKSVAMNKAMNVAMNQIGAGGAAVSCIKNLK